MRPETDPVTRPPKDSTIARARALPRSRPAPPPSSGKMPVRTTVLPASDPATARPTPGRGIVSAALGLFAGWATSAREEDAFFSAGAGTATAFASALGLFDGFAFVGGAFLLAAAAALFASPSSSSSSESSVMTSCAASGGTVDAKRAAGFVAAAAAAVFPAAGLMFFDPLGLPLPLAHFVASAQCATMSSLALSSRSPNPSNRISFMDLSAAATASLSWRSSGRPCCTLTGTRQHSRCTQRLYFPDCKSSEPTRTWSFGMRNASATWGHLCVFTLGLDISQWPRPVFARSTRYGGISSSAAAL